MGGMAVSARVRSNAHPSGPLPTHARIPINQLGTALAQMGAIKYTAPPTLDELRRFNLNGKEAIRGGISNKQYASDDEAELSD